MQKERHSRFSRNSNSFGNRQQFEQHRMSFQSLQRSSSRDHSLSKKVSLYDAMEIEDSNQMDEELYEELIRDTQRISLSKSIHSGIDRKRSSYKYIGHQPELLDISPKKQSKKLLHQCRCDDECEEDLCDCNLFTQQICVIGLCCKKCIQKKNLYLKTTRGFLSSKQKRIKQKQKQSALLDSLNNQKHKNMHYFKQVHYNNPQITNLVFCTCKKSQCQKKYCLCFDKGKKCGMFCTCDHCENKQYSEYSDSKSEQERNWERYATYKTEDEIMDEIDVDIDSYLEKSNKQQKQFQQTMEFQQPNFDQFT